MHLAGPQVKGDAAKRTHACERFADGARFEKARHD
jgi:hypothetical protein